MKTEWQEYNLAQRPKNAIHIEAILSKGKPSKDDIGIMVDSGFHFKPTTDNKVWVRFWVLESEVKE